MKLLIASLALYFLGSNLKFDTIVIEVSFKLEQVLDLKVELERHQAELQLVTYSLSRDYSRKAHLENAVKCYSENVEYLWNQLTAGN